MLLREVQSLARRAAQAGTWIAVDHEIFDDQNQRMAVARDQATADYLTLVHNSFMPLANALVMARHALQDRIKMTKVIKELTTIPLAKSPKK